MDHMTLGIGALWMLLNLIAAAFLGAEFIVQELRGLMTRRHERHARSAAFRRTSARRAKAL
jgi:UPF0716 family protein affecting phage T7 exclusion